MADRTREVKRLRRLLELQGGVLTALPPSESEAHRRAWRNAFAPQVTDFRGFDWHPFCDRLVFSVSGDRARQEYRQRLASVVLVSSEGESPGVFRYESPALPWFSRKTIDAYITPPDYSWTMVFTHEDDALGPYFTTPDWVTSRRGADAG